MKLLTECYNITHEGEKIDAGLQYEDDGFVQKVDFESEAEELIDWA